jgi:hypothetical protein
MIPTTQHWDQNAKKLQKKTKIKILRNKTMCKNKWNVLNSNDKKLVEYHNLVLEIIPILKKFLLKIKHDFIYLVNSIDIVTIP